MCGLSRERSTYSIEFLVHLDDISEEIFNIIDVSWSSSAFRVEFIVNLESVYRRNVKHSRCRMELFYILCKNNGCQIHFICALCRPITGNVDTLFGSVLCQ